MRRASAAVSRIDPRGRAGAGEDMALVLVLAEIVGDDLAFEAARGDDRDFALEGDEAFEDHRRRAERAMERGDVRALADQRLALAVVAEAAGLQDRGAAELGDRARERARVLDADEGRGLEAEAAQERLFDQPVLRQRERARAGPHRHARGEILDRRRRHVLELEGDDVDRLGEALERRLVVEARRRCARRRRHRPAPPPRARKYACAGPSSARRSPACGRAGRRRECRSSRPGSGSSLGPPRPTGARRPRPSARRARPRAARQARRRRARAPPPRAAPR